MGLLDSVIGNIATEFGVSPEAIKQVIKVESNFDPRASTGSYNGLTQIGKQTFTEAGGRLGGMSYDEFLQASPEKQLDAYRGYLEHYNFKGQMAKHGIDVSKLTPDQQYAVLQGMQFSPNGQAWKAALAGGNLNVPVTNTPQAKALGTTSLADMAAYFGKSAGGVDPSGNPVLAMGTAAPQGSGTALPAFPFTPTPLASKQGGSSGAIDLAALGLTQPKQKQDEVHIAKPMQLGLLGLHPGKLHRKLKA